MKPRSFLKIFFSLTLLAIFSSCGGGSGSTFKYPYETVFGEECIGKEPTPGCTFLRNGDRVKVSKDPDYDRFGNNSDDMDFVEFDSNGNARIYKYNGSYIKTTSAKNFSGFIGGTTIGVGDSGLFWENVANKTYWLGENGVLYSAESGRSNYGEAINNSNSSRATNTNIVGLKNKSNQSLIHGAAKRLQKNYGFSNEKAVSVASALNSWALLNVQRGYVTESDMSKTFRAVFGVQFNDALSAVKSLKLGSKQEMQSLTHRSAAALGLKPHQAQEFIKDMYKEALKQYGYEPSQINWMDEEGNN